MYQKYIDQFQANEIFPEGTELFVGITLIRKDGQWKQKATFGKIKGMGNTYAKKKPKDTSKYDKAKDIAKSLDNVQIKEMDDEEW